MNKLGVLQDLSHTWANSKYKNRELSDKDETDFWLQGHTSYINTARRGPLPQPTTTVVKNICSSNNIKCGQWGVAWHHRNISRNVSRNTKASTGLALNHAPNEIHGM